MTPTDPEVRRAQEYPFPLPAPTYARHAAIVEELLKRGYYDHDNGWKVGVWDAYAALAEEMASARDPEPVIGEADLLAENARLRCLLDAAEDAEKHWKGNHAEEVRKKRAKGEIIRETFDKLKAAESQLSTLREGLRKLADAMQHHRYKNLHCLTSCCRCGLESILSAPDSWSLPEIPTVIHGRKEMKGSDLTEKQLKAAENYILLRRADANKSTPEGNRRVELGWRELVMLVAEYGAIRAGSIAIGGSVDEPGDVYHTGKQPPSQS